jgi:hypothetical protein
MLPPAAGGSDLAGIEVGTGPEGELVINLGGHDRGKVLCAPRCCGRRRNVTTTKVKFAVRVFVLAVIAALDAVIVAQHVQKNGGSFGAAEVALVANLLVVALAAKPRWGRVGERVEEIIG